MDLNWRVAKIKSAQGLYKRDSLILMQHGLRRISFWIRYSRIRALGLSFSYLILLGTMWFKKFSRFQGLEKNTWTLFSTISKVTCSNIQPTSTDAEWSKQESRSSISTRKSIWFKSFSTREGSKIAPSISTGTMWFSKSLLKWAKTFNHSHLLILLVKLSKMF